MADVSQICQGCGCGVPRPAATARIPPQAWEPPYAAGVALKKKKKKVHQNSGNESTDTCHLILGGIFKSCLVVILQGLQTKAKTTNHYFYPKILLQMGLWNDHFQFTGWALS